MRYDRAKTVQMLSGLDNRELIDLFQDVFDLRRREIHAKRGFEVSTLCVAWAGVTQYRPEDGFVQEESEGYVDITLCARPTPDVEYIDWGDVLREYGKCDCCKAQIVSIAKRALCPVCRTVVSCT